MRRHLAFMLQTILVLLGTTSADAYSIGDVDPRALRGVWRLTSLDEGGLPFEQNKQLGRGFFPTRPSSSPDPETIWKLRGFLPMKEFTTYPKKKRKKKTHNASDDGASCDDAVDLLASPERKKRQMTEIFIKLKDDHTFQQCSDGAAGDDAGGSLEEELEMEVSKREKESFAWKGTWDFVDGKLILAADRPERRRTQPQFSAYDDDDDEAGREGAAGSEDDADTILVGEVAVRSEDSLTENPALEQRRAASEDPSPSGIIEMSDRADASASRPNNGTIDVHLSVPKGKIKTGKFMYPKTHPSFFEQPIYRPESKGRFELRQILGDYNAKLADEDDPADLTELFRKKDLVGKRFYLSTFPLPKRRKKFERWDVGENRYVQEEYAPSAEEKKDEDLQPGKNMQVVAVELFANNTFSTLYGLGSSTVLRGKWSIIGEKRDQLWMMVYRFGFGRSVSGSTFSEGTSLTQNDEKGYWGVINEVEGGGGEDGTEGELVCDKKIQIDGAVMVGWGLEPCSVGRFKMMEMEDYALEEEEDDDDEEEEYEEMSPDDLIENASSLDSMLGTEDADFGDVLDPFDSPGAFD